MQISWRRVGFLSAFGTVALLLFVFFAAGCTTRVHAQESRLPTLQQSGLQRLSADAFKRRVAAWSWDLGVLCGAGPAYDVAPAVLVVENALSRCVDRKGHVTCRKDIIDANTPAWVFVLEGALDADVNARRPASETVRTELARIVGEMRESWRPEWLVGKDR